MLTRTLLSFALAVGLTACSKEEAKPAPAKKDPAATKTPETKTPETKAPPKEAPPAEGAHAKEPADKPADPPVAGGDHAHKSPHGGMTATSAGGHLELIGGPDGKFKVWLLDGDMATRPVAGATATIKVAVADYKEVTLAVVGDHFEGDGGPIKAEHAAAVVAVKVGDKVETARFSLHLEGEGGHKH